MHLNYGTVVELYYAHVLRQSPETTPSTGFAVHQDTEEFDFIEFTGIVKLTPDEEGEEPSSMRVVGAQKVFEYGAPSGECGCFRARLYHASVAPTAPTEQIKIAFFFKRSVVGERRAKRSIRSAAEDDAARIVECRRDVMMQTLDSASHAEAAARLALAEGRAASRRRLT